MRLLSCFLALGFVGCLESDPDDPRENTEPPVSRDAAAEAGSDGSLPADGCKRAFVYRHVGDAPGSVQLAGSFEDWQGSVTLADADEDGVFTAEVVLAPGTYAYKFIVDGEWIPDPDNPTRSDEGDENSVAEHACPHTPGCLADGDCNEGERPLCRYYECYAAGEQPCDCEAGFVCDEAGACVEEARCGPDTPCEGTQVCREGLCGPECLGDEECEGEAVCVDLACVVPECQVTADCDLLTESCLSLQCQPKPCREVVFTYQAQEAWDSVHVAGSLNGWPTEPAEGLALELNEGLGLWVGRAAIPDGRFEYKLVLTRAGEDPQWIADPTNPEQADDTFGGFNSVLTQACGEEPPPMGQCGDLAAFDWRDAVMYFAMVDRFNDSDGRNDPVPNASGMEQLGASGQYEGGDLPGITERLPYLEDLGVSAIWLSAPYENRDGAGAAINPEADQHLYSGYHGYWPSPPDVDYSDPENPTPSPEVESRIGTAEDLDDFVSGAHEREMKVLFDYVMNHVDIDSGLYQAHPDWFARRDGRFALCGPENLWDDDFWGTRCAFTDYLPPFDFDNDEARAWSVRDAMWWAKRFNIDGYRLDAIKHVPLQWLLDLRAALNAEVPEPAGDRFYLVGETFAYDDPGLIKRYVEPETMLDGQFDFPYKARLCEALFTPGGRLSDFAGWLANNDGFYGPQAIMTTWIGNHDIPRAIHYASRQRGDCRQGSHPGNGWTSEFPQPQEAAPYERLGLAFAVMMTNPGIPLIYYGDEIGLAGGGDPDNRRMMPWNDGDLHPAQIALRDRVAKLGSVRAQNKVLARGQRLQIHADQDTWIYRMGGCGETGPDVTVAINRADQAREVRIPDGDYTDLMRDEATTGGARELAPRSVLILRANAD